MSNSLYVVRGGEIIDPSKLDSRCTVKMDGNLMSFNEFVTLGFQGEYEAQQIRVYAQANIISLAMALEALNKFFQESFAALTPEEQESVKQLLNDVQVMHGREETFDEQN